VVEILGTVKLFVIIAFVMFAVVMLAVVILSVVMFAVGTVNVLFIDVFVAVIVRASVPLTLKIKDVIGLYIINFIAFDTIF
jgi:hypothetical protein